MSTASTGNAVHGFQLLIFAICVAVAIVVLGAMIWSIVRHRRSGAAEPGLIGHSLKAELAWTAIPIAILIAMSIPAAVSLIRSSAATDAEFTITVTGYQWKWDYDYLDHSIRYSSMASLEPAAAKSPGPDSASQGIELDVDRPLVVPAGVRVRVQLTSNDVNHTWLVPELGRSWNAIPGHVSEFSFRAKAPGTYRGECAQFCGPGDTCVLPVVQALPASEFAAWLQANAPAPIEGNSAAASPEPRSSHAGQDFDTMITQGRMLHVRNCAGCHQASGLGLRAAGFPPLAGTEVSKDEHIRVALHGRRGSAMAAFGKDLGDAELAAIVTYQRNAWGNDTGDVVVPAEIAAAR